MILRCVLKGLVNVVRGLQPFYETSGCMYMNYVQFVNRLKIKLISDFCETCIIMYEIPCDVDISGFGFV